jgi:hypothetical protein
MVFDNKRTRHAWLLLLLFVVAEVMAVANAIEHSKIESKRAKLHRPTQSMNEQPADDSKARARAETTDSDPKGNFIGNFLKTIECDKRRVRELFFAAHKKGIKLSKPEVLAQYKSCVKEKVKKKAADLGDRTTRAQNSDPTTETEDDTLTVEFQDTFENWNRNKWIEKEGKYARISNSTLAGGHGKGLVFDGDVKGRTLEGGGVRKMTSRPFNAKFGGAIKFSLKLGSENGTQWCQQDIRRLKVEEQAKKKEEAAKAKAREEQEKRDLKKSMEMKRKQLCESGRMCNGHGNGVYNATCDSDWNCPKHTCTCKCIPGFLGEKCEKSYTNSQCQSVGDPHPLTLDGMRYNLYDAGEFVMFKHPLVPVEIHMLTRMAHPRIAATAGVAMKNGNTIFTIEQPHCGNGWQPQFRAEKDGKCVPGAKWGTAFALDGLTYDGSKTIRGPMSISIHIGGWWRYGWHRGKCGGAAWLNAYFNIRAPRDGKAFGLCGAFGKGAGHDSHDIVHSSGHRHHNQISRHARDKYNVPVKESFFKCGFWNPGFRYSPYFKSLKSGQSMRAAQQAAAMVDAEAQLSREFARDRTLNAEVDAEDAKNSSKTALAKEKAIAECKRKPDITTQEAMSNCVNDMMLTGDKEVEKVAAAESKEEEEESADEIAENEKNEELEMAAEAKLKVAGPLDPVLQWCAKDCKKERNWKQLKAYPEKVYGNYFDDFRPMTARIPDDAKVANLQIRFYQKDHTCHCCNEFYVDDLQIYGGGMGVSIVADDNFKLYADGNFVGAGSWYEPAKDTYRFRVRKATKVFAVEVNGGKDARMGVIASFGKHLVTSSSWKCTVQKFKNWNHPRFDDGEWPAAVEEGQTGILPWGERPGIAKKAFWIFTHDTYKMNGQTAYCRVNVADAEHSSHSVHPAATRWSCKSHENRQSPNSLQLSGDMMTAVEVRGGKEKDDHFSPGQSFTTKADGDDESRILMKINTQNFLDKTEEGAMLKRAVLRMMVLDDTENDLTICRLIREWSAAEVTWVTQPAYEGPKEKCITARANKKDQWAEVDISDWMRSWMSDPKKNYGIVIVPSGKDDATFVSHLDPDANQRPRLSLSCHGDRADANMVFKAKKTVLLKAAKRK